VSIQKRLEQIQQILEDNKAENIETFNLENSNYIVSAAVVATAVADRHLDALKEYLKQGLRGKEEILNTDSSKQWIVLDLGDIIVHIMSKEARQKYHLENFLNEFIEKKTNSSF